VREYVFLKGSEMKEIKNIFTKGLWGISIDEAHERRICISCKKSIDAIGFPTEADKREYMISGLCHRCFEQLCQLLPEW